MKYLFVFIKGGLIGIANIIPGVSGGTFALILGIYEKLLTAIDACFRLFKKIVLIVFLRKEGKGTIGREAREADILWLSILAVGALIAVFASSHLISFLLENHLPPTLAYFTGLIELLWSKERILEVYLNIVEFGPGIFGVEAACRHFYGKPASRLTPTEAASLAAVLPNPYRFHVNRPSTYLADRIRWIKRQMRQLGVATLDKI